jgi:GTPase SAR1 family protein
MTGDAEPVLLLQATLKNKHPINAVAWSPDGAHLATADEANVVKIWAAESLKAIKRLSAPDVGGMKPTRLRGRGAIDVAWSPDGSKLAAATSGGVIIWNTPTFTPLQSVTIEDELNGIAWAPDSQLLGIAGSGGTWITSMGKGVVVQAMPGWDVEDVVWTNRGLVAATLFSLEKYGEDTGDPIHIDLGDDYVIRCVAWSPVRSLLAVGYGGSALWISIFDLATGRPIARLEGHVNAVTALAFSPNGRTLASKSYDDSLILWDTNTWNPITHVAEPTTKHQYVGIAFHPTRPLLASLAPEDLGVRIWEVMNTSAATPQVVETIHLVTAKLALVGESNTGKSCLALQLAEGRYEEQGTTHGVQIRHLDPTKFGAAHHPPPGLRGELVLWDLGGQDEYRLVHQLFLADTDVALFVFDPTRGQAAFDDVGRWLRSLERQFQPDRTTKILVGAKVDEPNHLVDRARIDRLVADGGFTCYVETSAKRPAGIADLWDAIAAAVRWEQLGVRSRPALFQDVHDEIRRVTERGEVLLAYADLLDAVQQQQGADFDPEFVESVVLMLATQGVIVDSVTTTEERVLALDIAVVERYAGSLVIAARQEPTGVPALELAAVTSPGFVLPGITERLRLPRLTERLVLECVVQLLIKNDICLHHEGMLIFPSLFAAASAEFTGAESTVSLYYDFAGAIDNIYSSLVVRLAIGGGFGRVRLSDDGAAFERAGQGTCGIRKLDRGSGFAHIDVYFDDDVSRETRDLFISYIEDHLRQQGVHIQERLEMRCACGFIFGEEDMRLRIADSANDIGCPRCDRRNILSEGAQATREKRPEISKQTWALRTAVETRRVDLVTSSRTRLAQVSNDEDPARSTIRILHLSDLHITADADVPTLLGPLLADLRSDDFTGEPIEYLVVSGDLTNRATPREFEVAYEFVSTLIADLHLSSARCVLVPGNHDLSWDENVYAWLPERQVDVASIPDGALARQGTGFLVREEERYPQRFDNFSKFLYHPLMQSPYPLDPTAQCIPTLVPGGVQFLAFNSAWYVDEQFPDRSGIHLGALARGLAAADAQVERAVQTGAVDPNRLLRIAVWHHPVTGEEKMPDVFLAQLKQAGVRLCLHGHVHEARPDLAYHLEPEHSIHIAGAGSFGAVAKNRPESTPRLYNILTLDRDASTVRIDTRCMDKQGGAWEGWAKWPARQKGTKQTYYEISLD